MKMLSSKIKADRKDGPAVRVKPFKGANATNSVVLSAGRKPSLSSSKMPTHQYLPIRGERSRVEWTRPHLPAQIAAG